MDTVVDSQVKAGGGLDTVMPVNEVVDVSTKLSPLRKLGYASGDFGCNMSWSLISGYLMFYMTDVVGLAAGTVGTIMLISKGWDAINDPIIGSMADRTKSRWGRYRPWILFASIPMLLLNVLTFTTFPEWSELARYVWALGTYFILVLLYTMVNVPYSALPAALTRDTETRSSLASYRMTAAFLSMTLLSFFLIRVVNWAGQGNAAVGYQRAAIIFSLIAFPFFMISVFSNKENVEVPYQKVKISGLAKCLKGNKPVWLILGGFLAWGILQGGITVKLYYFTYNAGNQVLFANMTFLQSLAGMAGTFSITPLVKKVRNKASLTTFAFLLGAVVNFICYFLPIQTAFGVNVYYVMTVLNGLSMGMILASLFGMVPDTTEYTSYHYNVHAAGFIASFINWAFKVGTAISVAAAGWVLNAVGYVAGQEQSATALFSINFLSHMFVAIMLVLGALCMMFYKLDKDSYNEIVQKLYLRENQA